jgi:hypothetical protein
MNDLRETILHTLRSLMWEQASYEKIADAILIVLRDFQLTEAMLHAYWNNTDVAKEDDDDVTQPQSEWRSMISAAIKDK